jgi:hypothetical protein
MGLISLKLAGFENASRDFLVLEEPIPASAIDPEISQKLETVHFILDGGGKPLVDGHHSYGYSHQGGQILAVTAFSEEPGPAAVLEVVGYGTLSLPGSRAEADLRGWNVTLPPRSIIEIKQVSTQCNAARIDLWVVVLSAGILQTNGL